jgi:hypothetical protein
MSVEFPEFSGDGRPHDTLVAFVRETQKFLDELVQSNRDHNDRPLFHEQLRPSMRAAWKEVQPLFPEVERSIHLLTDDQLRDHGLVGAQLRFKLAVIRIYHGQYVAAGKRVLTKLADIIDGLLGSIVEATDAVATAGIQKFIKHSLED